MRIVPFPALLLVAACASSGGDTPAPVPRPRALLERAIHLAGGEGPLTAARALAWSGDAVIHAGGRTINIAGDWAIQPPDSAIVATYDVARGPASTRALVVAAPRGWIWSAAAGHQPMPPAMLASERDEFYLYDVIRLVPLRAPGVTLTPVAADSLAQPGFRAEQPGRPPVELFFDPAGRLSHLRVAVRDAGGGAPKRQDVWLSGTMEASGIRWFREMKLTMDGEPYFDLTLRALRVMPRVDDPRLAGPP